MLKKCTDLILSCFVMLMPNGLLANSGTAALSDLARDRIDGDNGSAVSILDFILGALLIFFSFGNNTVFFKLNRKFKST